MKTRVIVGALLVTACISDPAYIGEGPAGEQGGSSGGAGKGSTGGTPTAGANGWGTGLPSASRSCEVTNQSLGITTVVTWNAEQRTFTMGPHHIRYDANGLPIEWWNEDGFRRHVEYDEMGTVAAFTSTLQGNLEPPESWVQTNTYNPSGLLASSRLDYLSGSVTTETFHYSEEGLLIFVERDMRSVVRASGTLSYTLAYENGRPVLYECFGEGVVNSRYTAEYDDDGRLIRSASDWGEVGFYGIDGTEDAREQWLYDDEGRIVRYEADFESGGEYPSTIDGEPDEVYVFEPECSDIAASPTFVYGIHFWLLPYRQTGGWRFF